MTYETIFLILNASVVPAWALLVFLPRATITQQLVHSGFYPLILGGFYIAVMVMQLFFGFGDSEGGNFTSAAGVSALFQHPHGVLIGWSHYLVFDLFVGAWIGRDALRWNVSHWMAVPCQLLTFIFGPIGLFAYMILRFALGRTGFSVDEAHDVGGLS